MKHPSPDDCSQTSPAIIEHNPSNLSPTWEADDPAVEAKHVLQQLIFLSELSPRHARHLQLAIKALRWETKRTPAKDREKVMRVLESAASWALEDLVEETNLSRNELRPILIQLIELGLVERRRTPRRSDFAHGQVSFVFALTHAPAGSAYSSPATTGSHTAAMTAAFAD